MSGNINCENQRKKSWARVQSITLRRAQPVVWGSRPGELQNREAEVLTVTRDTTEADLKQRRELSRTKRWTGFQHEAVRIVAHGHHGVVQGVQCTMEQIMLKHQPHVFYHQHRRSAGSRTVYVDSAPVRCALRGRVLARTPRCSRRCPLFFGPEVPSRSR